MLQQYFQLKDGSSRTACHSKWRASIGGSPEKQNQQDITHTHTHIFFKKLTRNWLMWLWRAIVQNLQGKLAGWRCTMANASGLKLGKPETQKSSCSSLRTDSYMTSRADVANEVWRQCWRILSCLEIASLFVLFRPSTDCMRPTRTAEGNLPYLTSTNLNVYLTQQHPYRNVQNVCLTKYLSTPLVQPSWHTKLTITSPSLSTIRIAFKWYIISKSRQEQGHNKIWLSCVKCRNPFSRRGGEVLGWWSLFSLTSDNLNTMT